jgi:hypothetical protein
MRKSLFGRVSKPHEALRRWRQPAPRKKFLKMCSLEPNDGGEAKKIGSPVVFAPGLVSLRGRMGPGCGSTTRAEAANGAEAGHEREAGAERVAGRRGSRWLEREGVGDVCSEGEGDKEEREREEKIRRKKEKIKAIWTFYLLGNTKKLSC